MQPGALPTSARTTACASYKSLTMPHDPPPAPSPGLDRSLGLLALCLTWVIGGAIALWSLQQLRTTTEREARRIQSHAVAAVVAGAPAMATAPLAPLAPVAPVAPVALPPLAPATLAALAQNHARAQALCALAVLGLGLLSGWLAARGPGRRLERQRQQLHACLHGMPPEAPLPPAAGNSLNSLANALHALADGQQQVQEQEAAVAAYAQELLAVDFDHRLQAHIARILPSEGAL